MTNIKSIMDAHFSHLTIDAKFLNAIHQYGVTWLNRSEDHIHFFVQLGLEAKLHSLKIIEMLRKAHIPMAQSLSKDSLGIQLGMAERLEVPYVIIFGQKEALENVVIVRNMKTHSQETVKVEDVVEYIKKLR
jgi:histidyl-tRNA synthetase